MRISTNLRVAVALSGGMDSLRAAALLRDEGYDVFAIHMHLLPVHDEQPEGPDGALRTREESLRAVASRLSIPIYFSDLRAQFENQVIRPFLQAYQDGLTPNPCVLCNPRVKFGALLQEARHLGAQRLATGHYASVLPPDSTSERFRLQRGIDTAKDQSYFLYGLSQEQLAAAIFPLGGERKQEVAAWVERSGYLSSVPEESQEICFIPSGHYSEFLRKRLAPSSTSIEGPIIDTSGKILGVHQGIFHYTVGQRRGLGIPSTEPYYVISIDSSSNTVRVGRSTDLYSRSLRVEQVNWVSIAPPETPLSCQVRIRNQHKPAAAWVTPHGERSASICFNEPQRAVTPGQAAVFYEGNLLLGGGAIVETSRSGPGPLE